MTLLPVGSELFSGATKVVEKRTVVTITAECDGVMKTAKLILTP